MEDRIVTFTCNGYRMTFKTSDVMHIREYNPKSKTAFKDKDMKVTVITKVGNETKANNVDGTFDEVFNLIYGEIDG